MQSTRSERTFGKADEMMHSQPGRFARVAIGSGLVGTGIGRGGRLGALMVLVGMEPLLAGLFNFSLFSFLSGGPTHEEDIYTSESYGRMGIGSREAVQSHTEHNVGVESGNVETSIGT